MFKNLKIKDKSNFEINLSKAFSKDDLIENDDIVSDEVRVLSNTGYDGDILDKMFKSARYYFRKKSPVKPEPKPRRQYISVDPELLSAIDQHIIVNNDCKPEAAFVLFCKDNEQILRQSIGQICSQGINDSQLIQQKIKKTYKNRYFLLLRNK